MFDSLLAGAMAGTVAEALASAGVGSGPVAVIGSIRLSRALATRGYEVVYVGAKSHSRIGEIARQLLATSDALPLPDGELAALVVVNADARAAWDTSMAEWQRVIGEGGTLVMVARAAPIDGTQRALCGHLGDIEQRRRGRRTVTSGRVSRL